MKRLSLLIVLIPTAMLAVAAEPVGVDKRRAVTAAVPERGARTAPPKKAPVPRRRSVSSSTSLLSSDALSMPPSPGVLYPDLIPKSMSWLGSCDWNEAAGETCQSQCPPTYVDVRFGTRNASNRALSGPGTVKVLDRSTGQVVRSWEFDGLAAQGDYFPGKVRRRIEWCHEGASVGPAPPATHDLVVESPATEVSKDNNKSSFHVAPGDELLP